MKIDDFKFPLDSYEMKARIAPALLISLPVLVTLWSCYNTEFVSLSEIFKGIISIVIVYALSIIVRALGKKIEPKLWESWGGAPSTQIVSWRNDIIGDELKGLYLQAVRDKLKLPVPDKEDEEADPVKAGDLLRQTFKGVQGIIRQKDKGGLWSVANADYGLSRNLLGSRFLWLLISVIMSLVSGYYLYSQYSNAVLVGTALNLTMDIAAIYVGWYILPAYSRAVAFRYAELAWESFYAMSH